MGKQTDFLQFFWTVEKLRGAAAVDFISAAEE